MGAEQKTHFQLDKSKYTRCGKGINICSSMVLSFGKEGYPEMKAFERYGWKGCWKCQHCLAVCPQGAVSIFDKKAEDSKVNCNIATTYFELIANAFGLGTVIMSYPAEVLQELALAARQLLNIPQNHDTGLIVGFGYPEIEYARGVQKDRNAKIHRYTQEKR